MFSHRRQQAITWSSDDLLEIERLETNFKDMWIKYNDFLLRECIENAV